jgi:hypothetical protein
LPQLYPVKPHPDDVVPARGPIAGSGQNRQFRARLFSTDDAASRNAAKIGTVLGERNPELLGGRNLLGTESCAPLLATKLG